MNNLKFKTNIKCSGCISVTRPHLNQVVGEGNWEVDVQNPDKVLTIKAAGNLDANAVIAAVEKAGYKADPIQ